jgi:hypothetical protein
MDDGDEPPRPGRARPETDHETDGTDNAPGGKPWPEDDLRSLAEDWIAIWQSEITAYMTDPETQQAWGAMVALWAGAAQAMMRSMAPTPGFGSGFGPGGPKPAKRPKPATGADERRRPSAPPEQPGADAAPGPAPVAAAPVAGDDEIRRLEQRVAELERTLADQDRRRGTLGENRRARRGGRPRS